MGEHYWKEYLKGYVVGVDFCDTEFLLPDDQKDTAVFSSPEVAVKYAEAELSEGQEYYVRSYCLLSHWDLPLPKYREYRENHIRGKHG